MTTETTPKQRIEQTAADLGLTMDAKFIPWSQSRNSGEKSPSLNWRITINKKNSGPVLTTDYSAGCGHCPAYKASVKALGNRDCIMRHDAIAKECETGVTVLAYDDAGSSLGFNLRGGKTPILPDFADVLHSLSMDADVLNAGGFEEWASDFGYDPDSRKAESIYRACLDIALKLRAAIGDAGMAKLQEACIDY